MGDCFCINQQIFSEMFWIQRNFKCVLQWIIKWLKLNFFLSLIARENKSKKWNPPCFLEVSSYIYILLFPLLRILIWYEVKTYIVYSPWETMAICDIQKQPSRGYRKLQQIYRKTPMPKCEATLLKSHSGMNGRYW